MIYYDANDEDDWHEGVPTTAETALDQLAAERSDGLILYCANDGNWYELVPVSDAGGVTLQLAEYAP